MLAVKVDYDAGQATIGTKKGRVAPTDAIIAALEMIGYSGQVAQEPPPK